MPIPMLDTHIPVFITTFITLLVFMVPTFTTPLVFTALTHTALTVMPIILASVMLIPNTTPPTHTPTHMPDIHTTTMFITLLESTVPTFTTPFMDHGIKRINVSSQKLAMCVSKDTIGMKNKYPFLSKKIILATFQFGAQIFCKLYLNS